MTEYTDNYGLNKYSDGDAANLRDQYNASMDIIDTQMKTANDNASNATTILNAAGLTDTETAGESKTRWDDAASQAATNKNDIAEIEANLSALGVNSPTTAGESKTLWDGAASLAENNENKIADINEILDALDANNVAAASTMNFFVKHSGVPKHLVCIGDSWSIGYGLSSPTTQGWNYLLASDLGLTLHNFADGGAGFHHVGNTGTTFLSQANAAVADRSFNHDDSIVVILGNLNDLRFEDNPQNVVANAQTTFDALRTGFPNSRIIYITVNTIKGIVESTSWISRMYDTMQKAVPYGVEVYTNIMGLFYGTGDEYKQDENHPNADGHSLIANWIKACILNSNDAKIFGYKFQQSFNAGEGITANYTLYKSDVINLTFNLVFSNNITGSIDFTIPDYFITQSTRVVYAIDAKIYKRTSAEFSPANDMVLVSKTEPNTLTLRANTTTPTSVTIVLEFAPITSGSIFKNVVVPS